MINYFVGVGRLTAEAELRYTSAGTAVAKFSICINDTYKKDNDWVDRPYFFNCVVWGKYAEAMSQYLSKGRLIGIEGKLTHKPWTDGNGLKHNDCPIVINNIHLFPKQNTGASAEKHPEPGQNGADIPPNEDIPF